MRKFLIALLLLAGVTATANLVFAATDDEGGSSARERFYHGSHSAGSKYSGALGSQTTFGDSLYIGYSPGNVSAANPWSIKASLTTPASNNVHRPPKAGCMWNWDPEEAGGNGYVNQDSLQGWWPLRERYYDFGRPLQTLKPDYTEPDASLDFGNLVNYYPVHGRTFGVVGVWHSDQGGDPTGLLAGSNGVTWKPLDGTRSAWCGLRAHGDATAAVDPITNNPFTADAAIFNQWVAYNGAVNVPKFPGYIDQWDQLLYKDIDMSTNTGADLSVAFKYSTRMSTAPDVVGWFDKDPLTVTFDGSIRCAVGNFISVTDAVTGPVDSFMVYVGRPTETTFQPFNGNPICGPASGRLPIYDPLRRWFDEVVDANDAGMVHQIVSAAGIDSNRSIAVTIPNSQLASILGTSSGKVRLVFRVKTNDLQSDVSTTAYNSRGRGAAQVDSVRYSFAGFGTSAAAWGDFEASNSIDNNAPAVNAWHSTGKPPQVQTHVELLGNSGNLYDDLCGGNPTIEGRLCSMNGGIISFGLHDLGDRIGDPTPYKANHETSNYLMSPTIQLRSNNGSWPNTIGVAAPGNPGDAIATSDVMVDYEVFTKATTFNAQPVGTGILYHWIVQSYPFLTGGNAPSANKPMWGNQVRGFANYQTDPICFRGIIGITGQEGNSQSLGMLKWTTSASENVNYPDSVKIGWIEESRCYSAGVNSCDPFGGVYIDNVSLLLIDGPPIPISAAIWDIYQSAFPWNDDVTPSTTAAFDTAGILVKSGLDIGPADGLNSFDVPGDSIVATADGASPARMDLVFRVLPGPGNYRIVGSSASGLATVPKGGNVTSGAGRVAAVPNVASSNFWETFLGNNGPFGTPGGHAGGVWNPNVWNSARCDTNSGAVALFPRNVGAVQSSNWMGCYHEIELGIGVGDAYSASTVLRSGVGLKRHKCFFATSTALATDIDCEHDPDGIETPASGVSPGIYDLTYVLATGSGYGADVGSHPYTRLYTIQGTKIIPDGLLTPGAHVEYFWRQAEGGSTAMSGMLPDTNIVRPQLGERNNDGHRFMGFGALPDRWKQNGYTHPLGLTPGGASPACMLVVNDQTTNGYDWAAWTGVADTIGASSNLKWGAEVGWHAKGGGLDVNVAANNLDRANRPGFIAEHGGNPGTMWDGYQIIGAEDTGPSGSFGQRLANEDAGNPQINDKRGRSAPTLNQLATFYKIILWFTGNLNAYAVGPQADRGSDDSQMIKNWLLGGSTSSVNRLFWAMGDGFIEGNDKEGPGSPQEDLDLNYLGAALTSGAYRTASSDSKTTILLTPAASSAIFVPGLAYGVRNSCDHSDDVLKVAVGAVQAFSSPYTYYGTTTTYPASIYKKWDASKPWAAITEGYSIMDLMSRFGTDTRGRSKYFLEVLTKQFAGLCPMSGSPITPLDVPNLSEGNMFSDFVNLRNNPLASGMARIHFGLAKDDRVEIKVYDVTGREVRELANRQFKAGEHDIVWDGSDNSGHPVARGVYFTQVRYKESAFSDAKKLTVLK